VIIRREAAGDEAAIASVTAAAFASLAHSDQTEPAVIAALRAADALVCSLVAEAEAAIIGHAAFSPVTISTGAVNWIGLGPVAVQPEHQGGGVGTALIRAGLAHVQAQGAAGCVVFGNPAYYRRFGFAAHPLLIYPGASPGYFMALAFAGTIPDGIVAYHSGFDAR
jgi:putative acetyltransferase